MRSVLLKCRLVVIPPLLALSVTSVFAAAEAPSAPAKGVVAGKVGDRAFTLEEVDQKLRATNSKIFQDLYDARKVALDQLVEDHLLAMEAKKRGVTTDQLVKTEITDKIKPVTDADVETFFEQNKARMGGQTLDQMKIRIKPYLVQQGESNARTAFMTTLQAGSQVKVMLDPPRLSFKIADDDPSKGPKTAPVQIAEISDFQ